MACKFWLGAHSPLTPSHSRPAQLLQELIKQHGEHPALNKDYANCLNPAVLTQLQKALETGISRRSAIVKTYCKEKHGICFDNLWETHSAAHYLWHLSQPNHPSIRCWEPAPPVMPY